MSRSTLAKVKMAPEPEDDSRRFGRLLARASKGDQQALAELRPVLDAKPEVWRQVGDVAQLALDAQIRAYTGDDLIAREGAHRDVERLRAELTLPTDGALERLLIERILACRVQLGHYEAIYIQNARELSFKQSESQQQRIDQSHRRLLAAVRTLATVRKLALPIVQVNIADQQVNVAR